MNVFSEDTKIKCLTDLKLLLWGKILLFIFATFSNENKDVFNVLTWSSIIFSAEFVVLPEAFLIHYPHPLELRVPYGTWVYVNLCKIIETQIFCTINFDLIFVTVILKMSIISAAPWYSTWNSNGKQEENTSTSPNLNT